MKLRLHNIITACLLLVTIGGHLVMLQSVAWVGMIVSFSHKDGLITALEKTFDGKHPCTLCKAVDRAKQKCASSNILVSEIKVHWMVADFDQILWLPKPGISTLFAEDSGCLRFNSPPLPPPRTA